jgi:hypothetical protein
MISNGGPGTHVAVNCRRASITYRILYEVRALKAEIDLGGARGHKEWEIVGDSVEPAGWMGLKWFAIPARYT